MNEVSHISDKVNQREKVIKSQLNEAQRYGISFFQNNQNDSALAFINAAQEIGFECRSYELQGADQVNWQANHVATIELVGSYEALELLLSLLSKASLLCKRVHIQRLSQDSLCLQLEVTSLRESAS